jgi:hypothetical protein
MKGRPAAVLALAHGEPTSAAAKAAGVTARTVERWCNDAEFALEVRDTRTDLLNAAVGQLAAGAAEAVATLREAMRDPKQPGHVRVNASRALLDALLPLRESLDLEQRLAAIEAAQQEGGDRW